MKSPVPLSRLAPVLTLAIAVALPLAACDKPKSRPGAEQPTGPLRAGGSAAQPAPVSAPVTMPAAGPAPIAATSPSAQGKAGMAGFYVDYVNTAQDPLNKQPAVVSASDPITVAGFAFDAATKTPGKSVDLVIDGKAYGVAYGQPRPEVASYYKTQSLTNVGYKVTFPAGKIAAGAHTLIVRVVTPDGQSYQDSAPVKFSVQ